MICPAGIGEDQQGIARKGRFMRTPEEEKQAVIEWLEHPSELGKKPHAIEFTSQFTTEDGIECMIFKYKKSLVSPWLLAISSESGIFSEQEKYDPATEKEDALKLVEFLKQYWKNKANEVREKEEKAKDGGRFVGFVLLKNPEWSAKKFEQTFKEDWGIELSDGGSEDDQTKVYAVSETGARTMLAVALMPAPVPDKEAEYAAQYNFMWKDAVAVTQTHTAHIIVSVFGADDPKEGGKLFVKTIASLCRDENTLGAYYNEVVYEPKFMYAVSDMIKQDMFPLLGLVWFGIVRSANGVSAYTCGLKNLGKDEIEVIDSKEVPSELHNFMMCIAGYVVDQDVILHDGETIGFTNEQRLKIVKSAGVNVAGESLKILY